MKSKNSKPILFNTEMVQANLENRKNQTRRICKVSPLAKLIGLYTKRRLWDRSIEECPNPLGHFAKFDLDGVEIEVKSKFTENDILWVRETTADLRGIYRYRADNDSGMKLFTGWNPSIFMPKEAARIFLKVTDVRVERLQDINAADAVAEGIGDVKFNYHKSINPRVVEMTAQIMAFRDLWDSINGKKYPWDSNPWVWVYTFEQTEKPENFLS